MAIDAVTLAQFEQAANLNLQSYGAIAFDGNVDIRMAGPSATLTLDGGTFASDGGQVTIAAQPWAIDNTTGASAASASGSGSLAIDVDQLVISDGAKALSGFGSVSLAAHQAVIGSGTGSLDFGGAVRDAAGPRPDRRHRFQPDVDDHGARCRSSQSTAVRCSLRLRSAVRSRCKAAR